MFAKISCYNTGLTAEDRLINTDHVEEVLPHADVPVDPGAVATHCCELRYHSGATTIVLLSFAIVAIRFGALVGITDESGAEA
jgi:hypothetical protein